MSNKLWRVCIQSVDCCSDVKCCWLLIDSVDKKAKRQQSVLGVSDREPVQQIHNQKQDWEFATRWGGRQINLHHKQGLDLFRDWLLLSLMWASTEDEEAAAAGNSNK